MSLVQWMEMIGIYSIRQWYSGILIDGLLLLIVVCILLLKEKASAVILFKWTHYVRSTIQTDRYQSGRTISFCLLLLSGVRPSQTTSPSESWPISPSIDSSRAKSVWFCFPYNPFRFYSSNPVSPFFNHRTGMTDLSFILASPPAWLSVCFNLFGTHSALWLSVLSSFASILALCVLFRVQLDVPPDSDTPDLLLPPSSKLSSSREGVAAEGNPSLSEQPNAETAEFSAEPGEETGKRDWGFLLLSKCFLFVWPEGQTVLLLELLRGAASLDSADPERFVVRSNRVRAAGFAGDAHAGPLLHAEIDRGNLGESGRVDRRDRIASGIAV